MRWSDISQEPAGSVWTVPATVTKNRRSHTVPLSDPVLDILRTVGAGLEEARQRANTLREERGQPLRTPSEWVFPSPRSRAPIASTQKAFDRVRLACGGPTSRRTTCDGRPPPA